MPSKREQLLLELWSTALTVECGLSIKTDNRKLLQQQLYRVRQAHGTAEMEDIALCIPDKDGELWMVRKSVLMELKDG